MSRIGKQPIAIPDGVNVAVDPGRVTVNGPLGELTQNLPARMMIEKEDGQLVVKRPVRVGGPGAKPPTGSPRDSSEASDHQAFSVESPGSRMMLAHPAQRSEAPPRARRAPAL